MEGSGQIVFIIDDDDGIRDALSLLLDSAGFTTRVFVSGKEFLDQHKATDRGCVLLDVDLPGASGLQIHEILNTRNSLLPIIFITGQGDIPMAVESMRRGAVDFIRKPFSEGEILKRVQEALSIEANSYEQQIAIRELRHNLSTLTARELEVFQLIADGKANKIVAGELGISERTVEVHRSNMMRKLSARSLADLVNAKLLLETQ